MQITVQNVVWTVFLGVVVVAIWNSLAWEAPTLGKREKSTHWDDPKGACHKPKKPAVWAATPREAGWIMKPHDHVNHTIMSTTRHQVVGKHKSPETREFTRNDSRVRNPMFFSCNAAPWVADDVLKLWGASTNQHMAAEMTMKWKNPWCNDCSQWTSEPTKQWSKESMGQRLSESMNQWTSESMNRWINESLNQGSTVQRFSESMNQSVNQRTVALPNYLMMSGWHDGVNANHDHRTSEVFKLNFRWSLFFVILSKNISAYECRNIKLRSRLLDAPTLEKVDLPLQLSTVKWARWDPWLFWNAKKVHRLAAKSSPKHTCYDLWLIFSVVIIIFSYHHDSWTNQDSDQLLILSIWCLAKSRSLNFRCSPNASYSTWKMCKTQVWFAGAIRCPIGLSLLTNCGLAIWSIWSLHDATQLKASPAMARSTRSPLEPTSREQGNHGRLMTMRYIWW